MFFISSASSGVVGQSSIDRIKPGERGVVAGEQDSMLNRLSSRSQYARCDKVMSPCGFLSICIPRINLASPRSFIS